MHERPCARLFGYGVALLATAGSLLIRWPLWPVLGDAVPHMTFFPAVMIAAYFGGLRPGLLATVLSAVAANLFLTKQLSSFQVTNVNDVVALMLFVLVGSIISGLCESLHRARHRIVADERRRAEEALRESEQRFQTFVDHATDAFFLHDERHVVLDVNRQACESLGYTRDELLGMTPTDFDADLTPAHLDNIKRKLNDGEMMAFESRHRRKDGTVFPVEIRGQAFWEGGRQFTVALVRDITDRKRAEEALRESEQRFRGTFENAAVGIAHTDAAGRFLSVNEKFCTIVGYPREELLQRTFQEITYPDDLAASIEPFTAIMRDESPGFGLEKRYLRKDGSPVWVELFVSLQRDAAGKPAYAIAMLQDISERKRLEGELRDSEHRWRSLTEALPQFVWTASADGTADYFSTQITEYTGLVESELLAWGWMEVLHPDDRERTRNSWIEAIAKERNHEVEHRIRGSDGAYRWFTTRGVPIRDTAGHIVEWFGTCTDITEHKRSEQALRESEQRWRTLTETVPQLVWTAMPDGAVDYLSAQWTQYTGILESRLLDWQWLERLHPDDRETTRQIWTDSVAGRGVYDVEYRVCRFDGEYRWFKTRGVPIRDNDGGIYKWFGTCTDITDSKTAEAELRLAKEAAESANRAKDEFLANVSHEIRTPMNAVLGMTELILDTRLTDDQRQCLQTVKSAADNLLGIINDLLDFSKIEAGKLVLDPADFSLRAALGATLRTLAIRAHRKGLELVSHVQPDVPDTLVGDAGRLRQILLNLVGNATKFTDVGEIVVRVECASDPALAGEVGLRFTVSDTGIGIPPEKQDTVFRAFEQEDTSTTRRYGGTGLGLTIAARLVALMDGTITVNSEPGRGSTFAFTAQFGRQSHPPESVAGGPPVLLDNLPVLIVDDNATNRHILEEWLCSWQMEPVAVGDGVAAMDTLWDAVALGRPYPLVLLDARMPATDGLVLAAKVRKRAELSATRIILLTSGEIPADLARLRELRIDAHLLKPVQQDELLETIYQVMSRANGGPSPVAQPASAGEPNLEPVPATTPLHILVAEDNEFSARFLERLLARPGHRVRLASDGREALALAEEGGFDLLLLDVHMPELDGFQVVQALRERERTAAGHLPIIALTARSRKEDRERCLAEGMDDFLTKPIRPAELLAAIDRLVRAPGGSHGVSPSGQRDAGERRGLLDPGVLLTACGDDAEWLRGMCQDFQTYVPARMAEVGGALRDRDAPRLREAAHKLCALLSAFSIVAGDVASDLEDHAAGDRLEESRPLVEQLETMAQELMIVVDGLSIESLRHQATAVGHPNPKAEP